MLITETVPDIRCSHCEIMSDVVENMSMNHRSRMHYIVVKFFLTVDFFMHDINEFNSIIKKSIFKLTELSHTV